MAALWNVLSRPEKSRIWILYRRRRRHTPRASEIHQEQAGSKNRYSDRPKEALEIEIRCTTISLVRG